MPRGKEDKETASKIKLKKDKKTGIKIKKLCRIQKICLSLFKQIQGYEEDLEREMTSGKNYKRANWMKNFDSHIILL